MPPLGWKNGLKGSSKSNFRHDSDVDNFEFGGSSRGKFVTKKKRKQKKKGHGTQEQMSKQPTVEDASGTSSEGEDQLQSEGRLRKASKSKKNHAPEVLKIIEAAAKALAAIGGREEIEAFLQANDIEEDDTIGSIRNHCAAIINLLPEAKSRTDLPTGDVPSTIAYYGQSFVYRATSSLLYLLRPVEVFKGKAPYHRGKVFGFVRSKGSSDPAMCAFPGWTVCAEKHQKLLDPDIWTTVVKEFVKFHNHDFKVSPFDKYHGREVGDTYAAHVEPRLMLWFAIDILQKQTGKVRPPSKQRGDLWTLKDIARKSIEAEIVISRLPCRQCLMFQEFMERYTPIKFRFIICKNLGEVKFTKGKYKQVSLPLFADEIEDSETESESEAESELEVESESETDSELEADSESKQILKKTESKKQSNIAVVTRQKPYTRPASSAPLTSLRIAERRQTPPSEVSFSTTMTTRDNSSSRASTRVTVSQATQYYPSPKCSVKKKRRERNYFGDSDEDEWTPPVRSGFKSGKEDIFTPAKKVTRIPIFTPAFTPDALKRATNLNDNRKRSREVDNFQTPSKKSRASRY
jgi:hypothetical protein